MKKKSILFSLTMLVAVLFSSTAMAQTPVYTYGSLANWPTAVPADVKVVDSLYFCQSFDSLFPLELGYDAPGLYLSPKHGTWELISWGGTANSAAPSSYVSDIAAGIAAGNVFNINASDNSAFLFQYTANNEQCGLLKNQKVWVYIFLLPVVDGSGVSKTTTICKTTGSISPDPASSFKYSDLYDKAAITVSFDDAEWNTKIPVDLSSVGVTTLRAKYSLSGAPITSGKYTCGTKDDTLTYTIEVVDQITNIDPITTTICEMDDQVYFAGLLTENVLGGLRSFTGTYKTPHNVLGPLTSFTDKGTYYVKYFEFSFNDCTGDKVINDSIVVRKKGQPGPNNKITEYSVCRTMITGSTKDIYQWDEIWTAIGYAGYAYQKESKTQWSYLGEVNGNTAVTGSPIFTAPKTVGTGAMLANIPYWFRYNMIDNGDPLIACVLDSGRIHITIHDPFVATDYRLQVCKTGVGTGKEFSLTTFTGLAEATTTWKFANGATITDPSKVLLNAVGINRYFYSASGNCGGGNGQVILKVGNNAIISNDVQEKFCISKVPTSISLDEILGYHSFTSAGWTATAAVAPYLVNGRLDITGLLRDGILDSEQIKGENGKTKQDATLTFTLSGAECITGAITLKLIFTSDIVN